LGPQVWPPAQQTLPQHCAPDEHMVPPHWKDPEAAHWPLMQLPAVVAMKKQIPQRQGVVEEAGLV
jgi:hypothetical protein